MKPVFKLTANGADITTAMADRLLELAVTDEAGVNSDRLEIKLDDRDGRIKIPSTRAEISVAIGYAGGVLVDKGTFVIEDIELSGPDRTMTLRGTSVGASRGSGASRETSWHDTTFGDIAKSISKRHGWKLAINKELSDVEIAHEDQHENDMQFLSRLAAENDALVKVADGRLIINPHASGKRVSGGDIPVVDVLAGDTTEWTCTLIERGNYAGVKATYHDLKAGDRGEVVDGEDTTNTHTLTHTYKNKETALKAAKARARALKRNRATFTISSMPGDPRLRAEVKLDAQGFRSGVDGEWLVNRVVHRIASGGYTCSVDCETPQK